MKNAVPVAAALVAALVSSALPALGQEKPWAFAGYAEMREEVGRLSGAEKYAEAAAILEKAIDAYPDRLRANTYNLAYMRVKLGEPLKAAEALELGLSRGVWYGKFDFFAEVWAPLKALPRFGEIERRCEARRAEAEKLVTPRLDVVVPAGAKDGARLPLFIALHGGGENVDAFRPRWTSPLLEKGFIVAYPQSTQLVAPDGFDWMQDVPRTLRELKDVHAKLVAGYPVDPARVFVGGFSSGGAAALEVVADGTFPVAGFVSLCPPRPPGFTEEKARAAVARGVKGSLLTTERDRRLADQKEMAEVMRREGLLVDFVVTPDIGHWYPPDLAVRIDATLRAVLPPEPAKEP
jgi:predicted esterase